MFEFDPEFTAKLDELRAAGVQPFPSAAGMQPTHTSQELHEAFNGLVPDGDEDSDATRQFEALAAVYQDVAVAGRVIFRNRMGKAMFLRVQDRGEPTVPEVDARGEPVLDDEGQQVMRGGLIQVYLRKNEVGEEAFEQLKKLAIGDFVFARGHIMRTRTGELSVQAAEARVASRISRPFPDRFHSVSDTELRHRQRYVDLFMNASTRGTFRARSRIIRYIRDFFERREFLEVETPMMHVIPGGATARPFVTHHNALDMDLYLRVAPELFLKRLVVGGLERVFEINRSFRNEGISLRHNPEFTMLEFYWAWATYHDLMDLTEELLVGLARDVAGGLRLPMGERTIDYSPPFRRAPMDELVAEATGLSADQLEDPAAMEAYWRAHHEVAEGEDLPTSRGTWWERLFDHYVEPHLVNPTFVTGFPTEISPLARRRDDDPSRTDRFELFINGWEVGNAFTELNDPVDQAGRFEAQVAAREAGDDESMFFDRDYVRALTYGMPPTAGEGLGIDRLVMLLTNQPSIREVILFPTLRTEWWGEQPTDEG